MNLERLLLTAFAALALGFPACDDSGYVNHLNPPPDPDPQPESTLVALYAGGGADEDCITATRNLLEWAGCKVDLVEPNDILYGDLSHFGIICFPGGDMYRYGNDLRIAGTRRVRDFVTAGGGYLGICGGAYFAAERVYWRGNRVPTASLGLYEGVSRGPIADIIPYPEYGMCKVNLSAARHPITASQPDTMWVLYYWGPVLIPDDPTTPTVIGRYDATGDPAMLAIEYGQGRVFLVGGHPEFEEDSDRDGVSFPDSLDDLGTDWDLMKNAIEWCRGS